jgi:opacity protein-like surface antigen
MRTDQGISLACRLGFAALTIGIALPASASDATESGFYIGATAGGTGATATVTPRTTGASEFTIDMSGGSAGVMIGYLHPVGRVVALGIEGEVYGMDVNGETVTQVGGSRTRTEMSLDGGARIRGRVGAGLGRAWFVYGAVGWSQVRSKMTLTSLSTPGQTSSASETLSGVNFGVGGEYAFTPRLIARVEYVFDAYGDTTYKTSNTFFVDRTLDSLGVFTLRGGLSFKF